jgi:murein DD-endopeptidase MepM/ murein hydrolase activator NlpD
LEGGLNCISLKLDLVKENFLKSFQRISSFKISWKSPKVIVGTITLSVVLASGAVYYQGTTLTTTVLLDGKQIGFVATPDEGRKFVESILYKRGETVGQVAKTHNQIEYQTLRVKKEALFEGQLSEKELENLISTYIEGYELNIANERIAVLPSKEEYELVLNTYRELYAKPSENNKISSVEFREELLTKPVEVQPEEITSKDEVLTLLKEGRKTTKEYVVQTNDSWWLIARKNDMKTKEVLAGNPGKTEDSKLQVGQKVNLVAVTPYLTVISKGVYTGTETIPFDVVSQTDYNVATGQTVVKQQGADGSKTVTYSYVQENGKNLEKTVLEETITQKPVNQIVVKGPSRAPVSVAYSASRGSGKVSGLGWPLRGRLNSYYGYRWGSFHTGLDIDGDKGDPFVAAADGKVVSAGWGGGYGNMLVLDHGNGVVTRYAHATKLLVSAGQQVSKGQTIGLVGSTGNSTGSHLHFEVIVNGDTGNPLNYLP